MGWEAWSKGSWSLSAKFYIYPYAGLVLFISKKKDIYPSRDIYPMWDVVRTYISRDICPHYILLRFSPQVFLQITPKRWLLCQGDWFRIPGCIQFQSAGSKKYVFIFSIFAMLGLLRLKGEISFDNYCSLLSKTPLLFNIRWICIIYSEYLFFLNFVLIFVQREDVREHVCHRVGPA